MLSINNRVIFEKSWELFDNLAIGAGPQDEEGFKEILSLDIRIATNCTAKARIQTKYVVN